MKKLASLIIATSVALSASAFAADTGSQPMKPVIPPQDQAASHQMDKSMDKGMHKDMHMNKDMDKNMDKKARQHADMHKKQHKKMMKHHSKAEK